MAICNESTNACKMAYIAVAGIKSDRNTLSKCIHFHCVKTHNSGDIVHTITLCYRCGSLMNGVTIPMQIGKQNIWDVRIILAFVCPPLYAVVVQLSVTHKKRHRILNDKHLPLHSDLLRSISHTFDTN